MMMMLLIDIGRRWGYISLLEGGGRYYGDSLWGMIFLFFVGFIFEVLFLWCLFFVGKIEGIELNLNLSCNDMKEMN